MKRLIYISKFNNILNDLDYKFKKFLFDILSHRVI